MTSTSEFGLHYLSIDEFNARVEAITWSDKVQAIQTLIDLREWLVDHLVEKCKPLQIANIREIVAEEQRVKHLRELVIDFEKCELVGNHLYEYLIRRIGSLKEQPLRDMDQIASILLKRFCCRLKGREFNFYAFFGSGFRLDFIDLPWDWREEVNAVHGGDTPLNIANWILSSKLEVYYAISRLDRVDNLGLLDSTIALMSEVRLDTSFHLDYANHELVEARLLEVSPSFGAALDAISNPTSIFARQFESELRDLCDLEELTYGVPFGDGWFV